MAFWVAALGTLGIDQAVKAVVRSRMFEGQSFPLVEGIFHLTYVRNVGAAFGLFPGYQPIFITTSTLVLVAIAAYWRRTRPKSWPVVIAIGLVTGGAVGNLIDRVMLGRVTDFLDFTLIDFPVFNVADSAIVVGVATLILWLLLAPEPDVTCGTAEDPEESPVSAQGGPVDTSGDRAALKEPE